MCPSYRGKPQLLPVFPTPVGVFPGRRNLRGYQRGLPHARGGVSLVGCYEASTEMSSPRPWGCFYLYRLTIARILVFPTPVGGVSSHPPCSASFTASSPRPWGCFLKEVSARRVALSSPRPWGCFQRVRPESRRVRVFPTPVGVFPTSSIEESGPLTLPRAREGISVTSQAAVGQRCISLPFPK